MEERWTCAKCGVEWPAYTTVEAYRKHITANNIHPKEKCNP